MKIERSGEILVIRETPGLLWVLGGFFIAISSMFVYGALGGYSNWNEALRFTIGAHLAMGLIGISVGFGVIFSAPVTRIVIDRFNRTLLYRVRGLLRRSETVYRFDQIDSFSLIEEKDSDGDPKWSVGLKLREGEVLKVSRLESPDESYKRNFVNQANEFMFKRIPSYRDIEDESLNQNK